MLVRIRPDVCGYSSGEEVMNERIKELTKQSGMDIYGLGLDRNKWEDTVERFAELIIQKCCEVANNSEALPSVDIDKYFYGFEE
jgi:hypothetical protein